MYVVIVAFDLRDSSIGFDELRAWVRDKAAQDYAEMPGVRMKTWFSDERKRVWGAVYVVDNADVFDPANVPLLPNGRTGPVGTRPTSVMWLELEAFVAGPDGLPGIDALTTAGLALTTPPLAPRCS